MDRIIGFDSAFLGELLVQWVVTAILFAILGYFLYKPVKEFLDKRSEGIANDIDTAEKNKTDAIALKEDYEKRLANIEAEKTEILEKAHKSARVQEADIIAKAKDEAIAIKDRAKLDIEREQAKAKDDMKTQIIEISTLMANRFVKETMDEDTQNKLLDEVIKDLEETKWPS